MENATKALLIAASVLIAIILIAVGIKILGTIKPTVDQVGKVSTTLEVSVYNSQFTQYEGNQKGSAVRGLIRLIQQHNLNDNSSEPKIGITLSDDSINENGTIDDYQRVINKIIVSNTYNVLFTPNNDGYVVSVNIN